MSDNGPPFNLNLEEITVFRAASKILSITSVAIESDSLANTLEGIVLGSSGFGSDCAPTHTNCEQPKLHYNYFLDD